MSKPLTLSCPSAFRDAVLALGERRGTSVGALARAIFTLLPLSALRAFEDPGPPQRTDREFVLLKTGAKRGQTMKRKPRLQVRLGEGLGKGKGEGMKGEGMKGEGMKGEGAEAEAFDSSTVRRALALALALESKEWTLELTSARANAREQEATRRQQARIIELERGIDRLTCPPPFCHTFEDACHILGLRSFPRPSSTMVRKRFHALASVFHPDAIKGDHARMSQLNQAMRLLKEHNLLP